MPNVQHLTITVNRPPAEVYDFAADARNLPKWAAGLASSSVEQDGNHWIADAPFGKVRIKFAERNTLGVLDHDVTFNDAATGQAVTVHNPMRVLPHGDGSEFVFTLFRRPTMTDEQFAADKAAIEQDLQTLKTLLENT
jgi:carbon monoxide dehydrogenase subunit G